MKEKIKVSEFLMQFITISNMAEQNRVDISGIGNARKNDTLHSLFTELMESLTEEQVKSINSVIWSRAVALKKELLKGASKEYINVIKQEIKSL